MMTIKDFICMYELAALAERKVRCNDLGMKQMADAISIEIGRLEKGILTIGGDVDLLDEEYVDHELKTGSGGKKYVRFNGKVNYFPNAKYGRFVTAGTR